MAQHPDVPPSIPGYEIRELLGQGAFGRVYRAWQSDLKRDVALKVLRGLGEVPEAAYSRFRREAQVLGQLIHPNLVRVFTFGETPSTSYLTMELIEGGTLDGQLALMRRRGEVGLPAATVMRLARDLLAALDFLQGADIVHRDVKPSNVLLREGGQAVLSDLGLLRHANPDITTITQSRHVVGTIAYLAPEAVQGKKVDGRADLFSLGITLLEAFCGRHPTEGRPPSVVRRVPSAKELRGDCPRLLVDLLECLVQRDPDQRPRSARAALDMLGDSGAIPASPGRTTRRVRPRTTGAFALLGVAAMVALAWSLFEARAPIRTVKKPALAGPTGRPSPRPSAIRTAFTSGRPRWPTLGLAALITEQGPRLRLVDGPVTHAADWAAREGFGWLGCMLDTRRLPFLDAATFARLHAASGIKGVIEIAPDAPLKALSWSTRLPDLASLGSAAPHLVTRVGWLLDREDSPSPPPIAQVQADLERWERDFFRTYPSLTLLPCPSSIDSEVTDSFFGSPAVTVHRGRASTGHVDVRFDQSLHWLHARHPRDEGAGNSGLDWVWIGSANQGQRRRTSGRVDLQGSEVVRSYVLARIHHPKVRVMVDLPDLLTAGTSTPGASWVLLKQAAGWLEGLEFSVLLDRSVCEPHDPKGSAITAAEFRSRSRRVHVLFTDQGSRRVTYRPVRPGRMTRLVLATSKDQGLIDQITSASTSFDLTPMPTLLEDRSWLDSND